MNLAIDIGNSRAKAGIFEGEELKEVFFFKENIVSKIAEVLYNHKVRNVILASVSKDEHTLIEPGISLDHLVVLSSSTPLPFVVDYQTPETLGKDRLAAAAGVIDLLPTRNVLVVDAGTCITSDIVTAEGVFRGGSIAPGLRMRLQAMHHFTARLPLMEPEWDLELGRLGDSTSQAMQQGALWGAVMELEGMIHRFSPKFQNLEVVLTGGDAQFFVKNIKTKIFAHPNLVLFGLNKILNFNVKR